jgi:SAM-dependent methyltransferase
MKSVETMVREFVDHVDRNCSENLLDPSLDQWKKDLDEMGKSQLIPLVDQELDPFSPEYFREQLEVYTAISGRPLDQSSGELHPIDIRSLIGAANAYGVDDTTFVAEHTRTVASMLSIAALGKAPRVLDLGAGNGVSSEILASCGADVTALDIDPVLAELARARAAARGLKINRVVANYDDIKTAVGTDNRFSAAFFSHSFHHCLRPWTLLADLRETLTEDGIVLFGGEPVQSLWWKSWGIRLDYESLYVASKFGWFESGWSESFLAEMFRRCEMHFVLVNGGHAGGAIGLAAFDKKRFDAIVARASTLGFQSAKSSTFHSGFGGPPMTTPTEMFDVTASFETGAKYLCYGPYIELERGSYSVHAVVSFTGIDARANVGRVLFDVAAAQGTQTLAQKSFDCASGVPRLVVLDFTLENAMPSVEFRIRIDAGTGTWKCALPKIAREDRPCPP